MELVCNSLMTPRNTERVFFLSCVPRYIPVLPWSFPGNAMVLQRHVMYLLRVIINGSGHARGGVGT